jgi:hypothetical protein
LSNLSGLEPCKYFPDVLVITPTIDVALMSAAGLANAPDSGIASRARPP